MPNSKYYNKDVGTTQDICNILDKQYEKNDPKMDLDLPEKGLIDVELKSLSAQIKKAEKKLNDFKNLGEEAEGEYADFLRKLKEDEDEEVDDVPNLDDEVEEEEGDPEVELEPAEADMGLEPAEEEDIEIISTVESDEDQDDGMNTVVVSIDVPDEVEADDVDVNVELGMSNNDMQPVDEEDELVAEAANLLYEFDNNVSTLIVDNVLGEEAEVLVDVEAAEYEELPIDDIQSMGDPKLNTNLEDGDINEIIENMNRAFDAANKYQQLAENILVSKAIKDIDRLMEDLNLDAGKIPSDAGDDNSDGNLGISGTVDEAKNKFMDNMGLVDNVKENYTPLPIAENAPWDVVKATKNLNEFVTNEDFKINFNIYREAHLAYDPNNPKDLMGYHFQIADVVNGKLMAIPKAIENMITYFKNDQIVDFKEMDPETVLRARAILEVYAERLNFEVPWKNQGDRSNMRMTESEQYMKITRDFKQFNPFEMLKSIKENEEKKLKNQKLLKG